MLTDSGNHEIRFEELPNVPGSTPPCENFKGKLLSVKTESQLAVSL